MKNNIVILGVVLLLVLSAILIAFDLEEQTIYSEEDEYGTGLTAETTTDAKTILRDLSPGSEDTKIKPYEAVNPDHTAREREIHPLERYVVAWQPGGSAYSQLILSEYKFQFNPIHKVQDCIFMLWCECRPCVGELLGPWYAITYYYPTSNEADRIWLVNLKNNTYNTNYIQVERPLDSVYRIPNRGYSFTGEDYYQVTGALVDTCYKNNCLGSGDGPAYPEKWHQSFESGWNNVATDDLGFYMKGNHIGKIRTEYWLERSASQSNKDQFPCECKEWHKYLDTTHPEKHLLAVDEAYLISGIGELVITSSNAVDVIGNEFTPETAKEYLKYLYEEESIVRLEVATGYSGYALPEFLDDGEPNPDYGKGWVVQFYNSKGDPIGEEIGENGYYEVLDGRDGFPIAFKIPKGAWIENDPNDNEWKVVLKNTLFKQQETMFFVIDDFDNRPGKPIIETDKNQYMQYDYVDLTIEATWNPITQSPIAKMKVSAKYDSVSSVDYAMTETDYTPTPVSGEVGLYRVIIPSAFQATKGDKNIIILANCIDDSARPGEINTKSIYIKPEIGDLHVQVHIFDKDSGDDVKGAKVKFADSTDTTDANGIAEFYVNNGLYDLRVTKRGYKTYTDDNIVINSDVILEVPLEPGSDINILAIVIAMAIASASIVVAVYMPQIPKKFKPLVAGVGVIVAIFVYVIMSGII